jgi:hypothetical protein
MLTDAGAGLPLKPLKIRKVCSQPRRKRHGSGGGPGPRSPQCNVVSDRGDEPQVIPLNRCAVFVALRIRSPIWSGPVAIGDVGIVPIVDRNMDSCALMNPVAGSTTPEQPGSGPDAGEGGGIGANSWGRCGDRKIGCRCVAVCRQGLTSRKTKECCRDDKNRNVSVYCATHGSPPEQHAFV